MYQACVSFCHFKCQEALKTIPKEIKKFRVQSQKHISPIEDKYFIRKIKTIKRVQWLVNESVCISLCKQTDLS